MDSISTDSITLLCLGGLVLAALIALFRWADRRLYPRKLPYTRRYSLLTAGELRFYRVLLRAAPGGTLVFVKVRVMDVLSVLPGAWKKYGAPASGLHVAFVLADASTLVPVLAIELDDKSHSLSETQKRDAVKDAAFAAAGVQLLRVRASARYDEGELREKIATAMVGV